MDNSNRTLVPYESEIITVIVGTGAKARKFYVHKELVCEASPFFRGCLRTDRFPEGRSNCISLPEDSPEAFAIVLANMYHTDHELYNDDWLTPEHWFRAYVLADKLCLKEASASLMDEVMSVVSTLSYELFHDCPTLIPTILESPDCAATHFLIAQVAWKIAKEGYGQYCVCELSADDDGETCTLCEFFTNGGPMVVRLMKLLKGAKEDKEIEPCKRGAKFWIDQAKVLQRDCGGNASV